MKAGQILVVDDSADDRRLLKLMLLPLGYRVFEAADGRTALAHVAKEPPDVILLDINMPGMSGYDVSRHVKENPSTRLIPVVMLTGTSESSAKLKALETGVDEFLTKPVDPAELKVRLKSLIALKHFTDELENASNVLTTISQIVETRDAYTHHHCQRVGDYGASVALTLGLGPEDVTSIRLAGMFHDLGKIGIPDRILQKPSALTAEERKIIETHTTQGVDILKPMNTMARVIPLVRSHHERLDGSGYPEGLSGKDIPMPVRILTVVDIYDALATLRPYKPAFPHEKCLKILREEASRGWWDRDVVEAFAACPTPGHI
jgi:putative two-component system response regulator